MRSLHAPNPVLNEKERDLLDSAPEECFRHAVQRGALSLDEVTADLPPRVSAVVRSIAAGERLTASGLEGAPPSNQYQPLCHWDQRKALWMLDNHPQLVQVLDEQILRPDETMQVAHTLDRALGRYTTGSRYAAP